MKFIKGLFKFIFGIFALVGFLVVTFFVLTAVYVSEISERVMTQVEAPDEPENMVLTLDLSDGVVDQPASFFGGGQLSMLELIGTIDKAAEDPRVKGLALTGAITLASPAQIQEIRAAIARFQASGKPTFAFAETFGEAGNGMLSYYLASQFDEIWMQPSGDLGITGYRLEQPYFGAALEDWGVESQVVKREEYKGAFDFVTEESMPWPVRRNLQQMINGWMGQTLTAVSLSRGVKEPNITNLINSAPVFADVALQNGLVTHLGYWDEFRNRVSETTQGQAELYALRKYFRSHVKETLYKSGEKIALIYGIGPIMLDGNANDGFFEEQRFTPNTIVKAFYDAASDPDIKAILFRVDSPGGSYVASDAIWRAVDKVRKQGIPVIVSMGSVAASGGYFVAAPATRILAEPGTITGSIGVVTGKVVLQDFWDQLDITWSSVQAGENADLFSFNEPYSQEQRAKIDAIADRVYEDFLSKVSLGREIGLDDLGRAAGGRVWTGEDALKLGLIDALGGFYEAIEAARQEAGIAPDAALHLVHFPKAKSPFETFFEDFFSRPIKSSLSLVRDIQTLRELRLSLNPLIQPLRESSEDPRRRLLKAPGVHQDRLQSMQ